MEHEYKIEVGNVVYYMNDIESAKITQPLFEKFSVGNSCSSELQMGFWATQDIPRMAQIIPYVRDAGTTSWHQLGLFYIDTRKTSGVLTEITAYDSMLKAEVEWKPDGSLDFPLSMQKAAEVIASAIGVQLDSRSKIDSSYVVDYPSDGVTMREVLNYIGAANAGNWVITRENKLRLVGIFEGESGTTYDVGMDASSFERYGDISVDGIALLVDEDIEFVSGDQTGYVLEVTCPYGTQKMADNIMNAFSGHTYRGFRALDSGLDPLADMGDGVTINGVTSMLAYRCAVFGGAHYSEIAAPLDEEVDHEYPYISQTNKELSRRVSLGKPYYGVTISRSKGLYIEKTDGETVSGEAQFNSDILAMRALIDGEMKDCIYFDTQAQRYRLTGDVLIDGSVQSDAVMTDALYAEQGDISQLTVDRLETSDKIRRYLNKDTSNMQFIRIEGLTLQFIVGTVVFNGNIAQTENLQNRYGSSLYWKKDITDAEIVDGYPYVGEDRVYTTEDDTGYPVTVYSYSEAVVRQIAFVYDGATNAYYCTETFGQGAGKTDSAGNALNQGFMQKTTESFVMKYRTENSGEIGIQMNDDGFTDILGLRKTTHLDFSKLKEYNTFSEQIDGDDNEYRYSVERDDEGRIVKITDSTGHEETITW